MGEIQVLHNNLSLEMVNTAQNLRLVELDLNKKM